MQLVPLLPEVLWEMREYTTFFAAADDVANLYADTVTSLGHDLES